MNWRRRTFGPLLTKFHLLAQVARERQPYVIPSQTIFALFPQCLPLQRFAIGAGIFCHLALDSTRLWSAAVRFSSVELAVTCGKESLLRDLTYLLFRIRSNERGQAHA